MSKITVDIVGDSSKFTGALNKAESAGGRFSKQAVKGFGVGVGIGAFNLASGAISTLIGSLDEARDAYLEDAASQDMLKAAYERSTGSRALSIAAIEEQISANQLLGVSDSAQRDGIASFINLTNDATTAMSLNTATIELAAATGMTYEAAQAAVTAALAGRGTALKKVGVELEKGMTAEQLATAITNKFEGAQAKLAETEGGKRVVAQEKVGEAMEKVGKVVAQVSNVVLPIFADALTFVINTLGRAGDVMRGVTATVTRALIPVFRSIQPVVSTVFGVIGTVIGRAGDVVRTVFGAIGTAIGILGTAFRGIQTIATKVWNVISGVFKGGVNLVIGIVNGIIRGINSIQVHIGRSCLRWTGRSR
jgi:hypothetical protein